MSVLGANLEHTCKQTQQNPIYTQFPLKGTGSRPNWNAEESTRLQDKTQKTRKVCCFLNDTIKLFRYKINEQYLLIKMYLLFYKVNMQVSYM